MVGARADGHAHVVLDAIIEEGRNEIVALAGDNRVLWDQEVLGLPVLGDVAAAAESSRERGLTGAVVAGGDAAEWARWLSSALVPLSCPIPALGMAPPLEPGQSSPRTSRLAPP